MYHRNERATLLVIALAGLLSAIVAYGLRPFRVADLPVDARALVLLDRDGGALGTVLGRDDRHTVAVPLQRMSPLFLEALVAAEDGRFADHGAVDPAAAARALFEGLRRGKLPGGASTIAMQLARTLEPLPPGVAGQVRETILAQRIENGMSKAEVLGAYANRAPMGGNLYGVEAAARTYFGVDAGQLDLAQSAALASLPNAPAELDPARHRTALRGRMRYVLARMRALRFIDADDEAAAAREDLDLESRDEALIAPHFCFFTAARTSPAVDRVRTTIDPALQRFVEEQLREVVAGLGASDVHQAAALVIDNRTSEVLAYAGSVRYGDVDEGRNDGVQALRQPGSALKPFLYELAFERRSVRPYEILPDVPTAYAIPGARIYAPVDYSTRFLGPVRARIALADSLNVPAVRVLERTGVPVFLDRLHTLGFHHLARDANYYGLGLTLGGGEVSLWELARAYLTFAHGGGATELVTTMPPLSAANASATIAAAPFAADWAEVRSILADRHARAASFGVDSILALPFDAAVKTGTSSDFRDTWTAGFSSDYTVAVWVGNFDGHPMRGISGVTGAAPIWSRIMRHLHERSEPSSFAPPEGWQEAAICTTQPRLWHPGCARADEWLDARDLRTLRALGARDPRPVLGHEYDAWLAMQPSGRGDAADARILFPRDGDVFVAPAGSHARIDVRVATRDLLRARLTLDGRRLTLRPALPAVALTLGGHELHLAGPGGEARVRYSVVDRGPAGRPGFTIGAGVSVPR